MATHYLLDEREAARQLKLSVSTLQQRRFKRKDPAYVRIGRSVRYRMEDLEEFISKSRIRPMDGVE